LPENTKINTPHGSSSPFDKTAQHTAKREAILSESARLFNSKGARATTLADVAATLGLTKTSLYYYVRTKEDLIFQCYASTLDHMMSKLDQIAEAHDSAGDRVSAYVAAHFEAIRRAKQGQGYHVAALLEIASLKGEKREQIEALYIQMFLKLRAFIKDGISSGEFRSVKPTTTTRAILGALDWAFYWLEPVPNDEIPQLASAATSILLEGIAAPNKTYSSTTELETQQTIGSGFDREAQNRLKQEAFFKAGTRYFNRKGFSGTSLDEIAEFLNVSKGAFYYHIKSKDELLAHCYEYSLDKQELAYQQIQATKDSGLQKIVHACHELFMLQNSEHGPLIRYNTITALDEERRKPILRRTRNANRILREFLEQGIEDGSIRPINTLVAENLITGAVNAAMELSAWRPVTDVPKTAKEYFDALINGLKN